MRPTSVVALWALGALLSVAAASCGNSPRGLGPSDGGGLLADGGGSLDAGAPGDAGTAGDGGAFADGGSGADAGLGDGGAGFDGGPPGDGGTAPGDGGTAPAWKTARVVLHVHSVVSHDACDGHSDAGGPLAQLDQQCLGELKAALCAARIDVAFLTDHPSHMKELPFLEDLLYQPQNGDQLVGAAASGATASTVHCPDGGTTRISVGFEGTHTMPIGLARHLGDPALYGVRTGPDTPLADQQALLDAVHAAGGLYLTAHSEESDLPASVLQSLPTDGMEWYNVHGNILALYGGDVVGQGVDLTRIGDLIDALKSLEPFLLGATQAHPDLVFLTLLKAAFPEAGLEKWHQVLGTRFVTGVLGSDVHRNVSVTPLCQGALEQAICAAIAAAYPNLLTVLAAGGTIQLSDGDRIDSYGRVLRWLNNRVLVSERTVPEVLAALAAGRSYGIFAVFGEPGPFAFWAQTPSGRIEIGGDASSQGTVLHVRLPDPPTPELGASWSGTDASRAELRAVLWRTTAGGREAVTEWVDFGAQVKLPAPGPGAYSLEIWLRPRHLEAALGSARSLADGEYRWILANPIVLR